METGLFRQEELDARFVVLPARALATAELGGTIDFVPLPASGAKAVVKGAAIFFVVGQSLFSPSMLMVPRQITSVAQLRGQSLGFGQRGQASYQDGETILRDRFTLLLGEDNQAISIPSEKDRFTALEKGYIQAGLFSFSYVAKPVARGFRRLLRTGLFLPRVKGTVWATASYLKTNRDTQSTDFFSGNRQGDGHHPCGRKTTVP